MLTAFFLTATAAITGIKSKRKQAKGTNNYQFITWRNSVESESGEGGFNCWKKLKKKQNLEDKEETAGAYCQPT